MNIGVERVCEYCSKVIGVGTPAIWWKVKLYHESCFTNLSFCQECKDIIEVGSKIIHHNNQPYHKGCYEDMVFDIPITNPDHIKEFKTPSPPNYYEKVFRDFYYDNQPYPQDTGVLSITGWDPSFDSKPKRDSWNVYFMKIAELVSTRATCDRRHCGCVIVKDNRIVSTGYNGSNPGESHCDDVGHFMVNGSCKRTIHAEINAIKDAQKRFEKLEGCILYTNTYPCIACFWAIMKAGIKEVYFKDEHSSYVNDKDMEKVAQTFDIKIQKIDLNG